MRVYEIAAALTAKYHLDSKLRWKPPVSSYQAPTTGPVRAKNAAIWARVTKPDGRNGLLVVIPRADSQQDARANSADAGTSTNPHDSGPSG